ncbi:Zn-ribbon domain-containing OB-fold protein [Anaerosphaera multitolerans]|uniref:OB-fold domain-containing protein n=1 Tax=Anaerosphaera multitolerans TaxID=2487351 RepID=A0A437S9A5_9FIRM|nr:OB-fold domain-containing protein [Anaerosphaera multitolerans]RVU55693.1 OB-fold domain-containing protein [Anaerosphaera multitolerans]
MKTTIYSYTKIYVAGKEYKDDAPFISAILDEEGNRFIGIVEENGKEVKIGAEVSFLRNNDKGKPVYSLK